MKKIFSIVGMVIALGLPAFNYALAQNGGDVIVTTPKDVTVTPKPDVTVTPGTAPVMSTLTNPLKVKSLNDLYKNLLVLVIEIGYVVVAFFLLLSGFKFVTAQGNESKLEEAKSTFYGTIIGAVIVIGANTIYAIVENVVKSLNK